MRRPLGPLALAAGLIACGVAPGATSPEPSLSSATASPTPVSPPAPPPLAGGTPTPLPTARAGEIRVSLEAGQVPANADGAVLIVTRRPTAGRDHTRRTDRR